MDKYNLKVDKYNLKLNTNHMEGLAKKLQDSNTRMYDVKGARYNVDNCECPECPCCDPEMKWLWAVGAGVLAASTPILLAAVAADIVKGN